MLTFSPAQFNTFQTRWQIDRLQAQLPGVLIQLAEKYPEFYAQNNENRHQQHAKKRIEQAVFHGYTDIEHIQQLLDLEYQARQDIYGQNPIQSLYQANCLQPQDRIDSLPILLHQKDDGNPVHDNAYKLLEDYPLEERSQDIATLTSLIYADDSRAVYLQILRQALYHAVLKDALQTAQGWQAWRSDGQQARIGIEHPGHRRRIRLRPADGPSVQVTLDEPHEEPPLLTLHVPDRLNAEQHARLKDILHAWAYDLLPATPMRARFIPPEDTGPPPQTPV